MKRFWILSATVLLLVGLLSSCDQIASSVVSKLTYSDSPTYSGSTWSSSFPTTTIYKVASTTSSGSTSQAGTTITLNTTSDSLKLNSDNSFTITATVTNDSTNYQTNYISANWNYSTSPTYLSFPSLVSGDTAYYQYFINGLYYNVGSYIEGTFYSSSYNVPSTAYSIAQTPLSTKYNGNTVYAVTYNTLSSGNGSPISVETITGTWSTYSGTNDPTNTTSSLNLAFSNSSTINYTYGSTTTTSTSTQTYPAGTTYPSGPSKTTNPSTGKDTYVISFNNMYFYAN